VPKISIPPGVLVSILQNVALPELIAWIKSRQNPSDPITDDEIHTKFGVDVDSFNAAGLAFLAQFTATS
jgi:hypothetical protein